MLDQLAQAINATKPPGGMRTKIVGIDGGGGAGKSTLAAKLIAVLPGAVLIHVDDFIPGPDNDNTWWQRLREQVYVPLSCNQPAHYQRFDWPLRRLAEWREVPATGIVIVEGFSALRPEFRSFTAYGIWVDAPPAIRLARGLARGNEDLAQWEKWQISDQAYLETSRPDLAASIIVHSTKAYT